MTLPFTPRPSQQNILRYTGGRLGIAAVPGAGKTHILSARISFNRQDRKEREEKLKGFQHDGPH